MTTPTEEITLNNKSWIVLSGTCLVFFTTTPYLSVFELLYENILNESEDSTKVGTWTFTIYIMMWNFISLFVGPLCIMQSHRWTCSIGVSLMGIGVILSSFAKTSTDLYLSSGLIAGCGQGLIMNTCILILVEHFGSKKGLALGASFMIMAIGGIVAPQIVCGLLSHVSHKASIQIFGCLILVSLIGSSLFFPMEQNKKYHLAASEEEEGKSTNNKPTEDHNFQPPEPEEQHQNNSKWKKNPIVKMFLLTKWSLVKDPHFILTVLGSAYSFNALLTFLFYLPLYATSIGLSLEGEESSSCQKSNLLSIVAGIDAFTRFLFAWMGDWSCSQKVLCGKPRRILYAIGVLGVSVIMIFLPFMKTYNELIIGCVIYGIFAGGMPGNGPLVYSEDFQKDLPSAMGIASIGRALAALSMGPVSGIAKNPNNGVQMALWITGSISMFWMVLWIIEVVYKYIKELFK